jgi:hypothetical protein
VGSIAELKQLLLNGRNRRLWYPIHETCGLQAKIDSLLTEEKNMEGVSPAQFIEALPRKYRKGRLLERQNHRK